jgi:hypothetical protein
MTVRTAAQLKAEFQQTDPQDFANDLADTIDNAAPTLPFYLGNITGETTNLGATFLSVTGRAHVKGDIAVYYDTVGAKYHMCFATGTGASNWQDVLVFD